MGYFSFILFEGAPVVITLPHMLGASVEYSSLIKGFNPDPNKHKTFVDIQEVTEFIFLHEIY